MNTGTKLQRWIGGTLGLAGAVAKEPRLARDLPRWVREAGNRHDPLAARQPWWNYRVLDYVDRRLRPGSRVFEFGGGASTLWLADKGCRVRTVEHDPEWHAGLTGAVGDGADVLLVPPGDDFTAYVNSVQAEPDGSLDLVIVDGRERVRCGLAAMSKVAPGGMLLLDDSERPRYQPLHDALSGWSAVHLSGLKAGDWTPRQTSVWTRPAG